MVPAVLVLAAATVRAGQDDRPTLSVVALTATRSSFPADQALELADDLAMRLVDTGRFRVLPAEWLTAADLARRMTPEALRQAADDAGVRYLVSGSITDIMSRTSATPRTILGAAGAILAQRHVSRLPVRCALPPPVQQFQSVEVRVVDVASGAVVRTAVARTRPSAAGLSGGACLGAPGFPGLAAARGPARPDLTSLKLANAEIASTLTLPAPAAH
jgi:hypothetical protein